MLSHHRARLAAAREVLIAMKEGRLPRPTACEVCGCRQHKRGAKLKRFYVVWHHWSYAAEHALDVIPLCTRCHSHVHHGRIPEPRTGRVYVSPMRSAWARIRADRQRYREARAFVPGRNRVEHTDMLGEQAPA